MTDTLSNDTVPTFKPLSSPEKLWGLQVSDKNVLKDNYRRFVPDLVRLFISRKIPITLWGPVGARKTRTIEAFSREKDENGIPYQVITVQPSHEDPTVIHGMRYTSLDPESGQTIMERSVPDIAQEIVKYNQQTGGLTILFLDEMTTCMPAQQHAMLGLLTHGKYGDIDISPYMCAIMAANPEGTVSSVYDLGEQVVNRGGHVAWYGDPSLFLEEWRDGFGIKDLRPDPEVDWFISTLIDQSPEDAFRSSRWKLDELVPYDLFEHSERTTTELAKMVETINDVFASSPDSVRHHYIIEATRALQGPEWAKRAQVVCSLEGERIDGRKIIKIVRESQLDPEWSLDELKEAVGDSMYTQDTRRGASSLEQDQINAVAVDLVGRSIDKTGGIANEEASLALWAFASTAPDEATRASMHSYLMRILTAGFKDVKSGKMEASVARPKFVPEDTLSALRAAIARARAQ